MNHQLDFAISRSRAGALIELRSALVDGGERTKPGA
jgi:hypothetical protein